MKRAKKIFLLFLAVTYLFVAYDSLVQCSPIELINSGSGYQKLHNYFVKNVRRSFIQNRRHLQLVKKIESGKLYPFIQADYNITNTYEEYITYLNTIDNHHKSPFSNLLKNKAPPVSC